MSSLYSLAYLDAIARMGSIRKAAETLSITSTALNRRLLALETELGTSLFERDSRGVHLSAAGEVMLQYVRRQTWDLEEVKSQISDLKGERRGRVAIACSQAFLPYFLPSQVAAFRLKHPGVVFTVLRREREAAEQALLDHSADLALVVEPVSLSVMNTVLIAQQDIHAVMRSGHPLEAKEMLLLDDCIKYPIGLPTPPHGVRQLIDLALAWKRKSAFVAVESDSFDFLRNYREEPNIVTFQIAVGLPDDARDGLIHRPVDRRDLPPAEVFVGHLLNRELPSAAASFLEQVHDAIATATSDGPQLHSPVEGAL